MVGLASFEVLYPPDAASASAVPGPGATKDEDHPLPTALWFRKDEGCVGLSIGAKSFLDQGHRVDLPHNVSSALMHVGLCDRGLIQLVVYHKPGNKVCVDVFAGPTVLEWIDEGLKSSIPRDCLPAWFDFLTELGYIPADDSMDSESPFETPAAARQSVPATVLYQATKHKLRELEPHPQVSGCDRVCFENVRMRGCHPRLTLRSAPSTLPCSPR